MIQVLIVDDREESRYLLRMLLQGHGYIVYEACHGDEALTKARETVPGLIISDLLMPVMDGYTLLRHWKSDAQLCQVPFIVYTATYTEPKDEQLAIDLGADAFIVKPAEPDLFLARIQEVMSKHESGGLKPHTDLEDNEDILLKRYNEVLIRKLESKMEKLEQANQSLKEEIEVRKETEELLRKLTAAVEQSPVGVIITDIEGKFEYVNPTFTEMTGYSLEELEGQTPRLLKSGETPEKVYQTLWETISSGGSWRGEFHNRRRDGSLYWDQSAISSIRDASGVITHYLSIKEDITAQKVLEAQYLQAQKMEAVGRLAGGIAHDFNNMLGVIMGYTEGALMTLDASDPLYQDLEQVRMAADRSASLTRHLLAFSRQQTIAPVVMDLNEQMQGMEGLLSRLIQEDIEMQLILSPGLWPVSMDPSQMDQIVANLTVNARDAMPDGGKLTIETKNVHIEEADCHGREGFVPGDYVMLVMSDTGFGMNNETMANIFEPFFTTKGEDKGTGLGLATVYGIIRQNNGFIHVYSEPDHGSTFRIYLPRYRGDAEPVTGSVQVESASRGQETILLVEDDSMLCTLTKRMLEWFGYTVIEALGPNEAIALAQAHHGEIHLLMTDVVMPVMNGKDLQERICRIRPGIQVLYTSGYTADTISDHGVLEKGTNFIGKPFNMNDLGKKVRQILDSGGGTFQSGGQIP